MSKTLPSIIRSCCLNLSQRFVRCTTVAAAVVLVASQAFAWTINSRELVDVELSANGSLTILVSAPRTESPGLYEWQPGASRPTKICAIPSPSFFSFDRRIVIERVRGEHDLLRLYDAATCSALGHIDVTGRVIDADARGALVAIATQYPGKARALELYTNHGKRIARAKIGGNVELGFAPDGNTLLNFDLSDTQNASWRLRSLARTLPAQWINKHEVAFIPGAQYVSHYAEGALSIMHWATGKPEYTTPTARTVRVRQLSSTGRFGVIHERLAQTDSVGWLDFATGARVQLGVGSIDHAAINADGTQVAWTQRGGLLGDEVTVLRRAISSTGTLVSEN